MVRAARSGRRRRLVRAAQGGDQRRMREVAFDDDAMEQVVEFQSRPSRRRIRCRWQRLEPPAKLIADQSRSLSDGRPRRRAPGERTTLHLAPARISAKDSTASNFSEGTPIASAIT